ncbi:MerR family transcriptional regulator [Thiomicrorhabdus arctica]|jgi:DNA-binding transcriptional MerR regulator|uniref:MerR family transcriptional regulator n=1 Tax=Thiomicrorhabdus arctica TaxID=131540 RepID=UPI000371185F|nr:MerR family transcriptional regulator [Thiomicrorhabdus arctica]
MAKPKNQSNTSAQLEIELPDKKYFTIGEVAELCQLKSHVLRYWEQVFPQLEPSKRSGRRYYQRIDVELVLEIKSLLHDQGFTIPGAKARLSKGAVDLTNSALSKEQKTAMELLQTMQSELLQFRQYIKSRF